MNVCKSVSALSLRNPTLIPKSARHYKHLTVHNAKPTLVPKETTSYEWLEPKYITRSIDQTLTEAACYSPHWDLKLGPISVALQPGPQAH